MIKDRPAALRVRSTHRSAADCDLHHQGDEDHGETDLNLAVNVRLPQPLHTSAGTGGSTEAYCSGREVPLQRAKPRANDHLSEATVTEVQRISEQVSAMPDHAEPHLAAE